VEAPDPAPHGPRRPLGLATLAPTVPVPALDAFLITVHVTSAAVVVGVLFLQSLAVVMALRLPSETQRQGVRMLQARIQAYAYYPLLALTLVTGLSVALLEDAFEHGRWLHWKLVLVVLLIGLGLLTGQGLRSQRPPRPLAIAVHVAVVLVAAGIVYLAVLQPF
jgi:uncharacterized membrane protein